MNLTNPTIQEQQRNNFSYFCSGKANNKNNNMKKHNHILAAAGKLLVALVTVGTLFPACAEVEPDAPERAPRNLVIEEFRYDGIPAKGGSVKPVISYSYEVFDQWRYVKKTDGAVLTFSVSEPLILGDDGTVTAPSNTSEETMTHHVTLTVTMNDLKTEKTADISQVGTPYIDPEGVKSVEYTLVPLELGPHEVAPLSHVGEKEIKMISENKDGFFHEQVNTPDGYGLYSPGVREKVACTGTQIPFTGGDLLKTVTYNDGRVESEIVEKAVFSVEYSYPDATDALDNGRFPLIETIPATLPVESIVGASVADGVWTINKIDSPFTGRGVHKLIATTSRGSQSITLDQNANIIIDPLNKLGKWSTYYEFSGNHKDPICWRFNENVADFEDYPPGSDPQWVVSNDGVSWCSLLDTRGMHPDNNRNTGFFDPKQECKIWRIGTLRSGDEFRTVIVVQYNNYIKNGVIITAEAEIPTAEGFKHSELQYEYPDNWTYCFEIFIPYYPEATENFKWTVTFKYPKGTAGVDFVFQHHERTNPEITSSNSNWDEVSHMFTDVVYVLDDYKSRFKDWKPYAPGGWYVESFTTIEAPPTYEPFPCRVLKDGVEIAWEKLREGHYYNKGFNNNDGDNGPFIPDW